MIVVVMGLSGSGKSFLASILHQDFGFEWLRSDLIRKELAGINPYESAKSGYGEGIYSQEWTKRVYEEMIRRAKELVCSGKNVVLDATFLQDWQRELVKKSFPNAIFLLAYADEQVVIKRLRERRDVSDADVEVYLKQKENFVPPSYAIPIDTNKSRDELKVVLQEILQRLERKDIQENAL
ncbi:AAA family ATPase [Pampinifervens florentissimum]|uniref:AAA family ATPase n=1 Tax=Pampinifervens florentissimum TaxID=1632019 RepID=UPI0013B47A9D|nr:AAA family ATPase [Hydrogenobacter sp. T-8]QID33198.1 AAA family ATPase [Hydrogenobacter sp. T-8]